MAATWETYLDPLVTPTVQNNLPYQVVRQAGRNSSNEPPPGSISRRLDDMLSTPLAHVLSIMIPQGDSSSQNFLRMTGLAIRSTISCIIDDS